MQPLNVGVVMLGSEVSGTPPTKSTGVGLATSTGAEVGRSREKLGSVEDSVPCRRPSTNSENCSSL